MIKHQSGTSSRYIIVSYILCTTIQAIHASWFYHHCRYFVYMMVSIVRISLWAWLQHALHVRYDIYNNKHRENIHQHLFSTSTFVQTYKFLMFHTTITSKRQNYGMNDLQQCIWCIGPYMHARSSSIQKYVGSIFYFNSVSIGMVGYHYYVHTIQKIRNYNLYLYYW